MSITAEHTTYSLNGVFDTDLVISYLQYFVGRCETGP